MSLHCKPCRMGDHRHCHDVWDPDTRRLLTCDCWESHEYEAPEEWPDDWDTAGAETRYERMMGDR